MGKLDISLPNRTAAGHPSVCYDQIGSMTAGFPVILKSMEALDRITWNPAVMGGKPCIRGIRMTVGTIVGLLASGRTTAEVLAAYPFLEDEDVRQALQYAAWRVQEIEVLLPAA